MEDLAELRDALQGARSQVRALQRTTRTTLQVVNDLEERIDRCLAAQPKEGTANGHTSYRLTKNTST
jgi:chromosome segregation ATPase